MRRNFVPHPILRRISRLSRWIVALIIFLVVVRISLPFVVKAYVNHKLNEANDYAGQIGDVDMKLWKGGYRIHQIDILKKTAGVQSPLFSAKVMDLSIEWRELFHGAIVGEVALQQLDVGGRLVFPRYDRFSTTGSHPRSTTGPGARTGPR